MFSFSCWEYLEYADAWIKESYSSTEVTQGSAHRESAAWEHIHLRAETSCQRAQTLETLEGGSQLCCVWVINKLLLLFQTITMYKIYKWIKLKCSKYIFYIYIYKCNNNNNILPLLLHIFHSYISPNFLFQLERCEQINKTVLVNAKVINIGLKPGHNKEKSSLYWQK